MVEFICAIPLLAAFFSVCAPLPPLAVGYVEGDYVLIAPIETARLETLTVARGDKVEPGQVLAILERGDVEIALMQKQAVLIQMESQLANLQIGKRPAEVQVVEAALAAAKSQSVEAKRVLKRSADLLSRQTISQAHYDTAATELERANAKVDELTANLSAIKLPARHYEIKSAEAMVEQAKAAINDVEWRLENRTLVAPSAATVIDIIRNSGEVAGPQAPVLSVLPEGAIKLRLYVPEPSLARINLGAVLDVHCDGCVDGMTATITYIATETEFTPPIIYSEQNRQKLVYLVEGKPDANAIALKPGQIIDVTLPGTKTE